MAEQLSNDLLTQLAYYCRLDASDPVVIIELTSLYWAAVSYLTVAGVEMPDEGSALRPTYDLLVQSLVLADYDHRGSHGEETIKENPAFRRRLNQLKLALGVGM